MRLSQYIGDFHPDAQVNGFCGCSLIALICSKYSAIFNAISSFIMSRKTIKVFVNNIPLVFLSPKEELENYPYYGFFSYNDDSVDRAIQRIESDSDSEKGYGYCVYPGGKELDKVIINLRKRYKYIEAAGGLVLNEKGKVLMIHRLGVWDLPKGKLDKGETPRKAAIREIEEESG